MSSARSSRWVYCLDELGMGLYTHLYHHVNKTKSQWGWSAIHIWVSSGVVFFLGCFRGKARITTHFEGFISHLSEGARHGPTFLDKLEPANLGTKETHP